MLPSSIDTEDCRDGRYITVIVGRSERKLVFAFVDLSGNLQSRCEQGTGDGERGERVGEQGWIGIANDCRIRFDFIL